MGCCSVMALKGGAEAQEGTGVCMHTANSCDGRNRHNIVKQLYSKIFFLINTQRRERKLMLRVQASNLALL